MRDRLKSLEERQEKTETQVAALHEFLLPPHLAYGLREDPWMKIRRENVLHGSGINDDDYSMAMFYQNRLTKRFVFYLCA